MDNTHDVIELPDEILQRMTADTDQSFEEWSQETADMIAAHFATIDQLTDQQPTVPRQRTNPRAITGSRLKTVSDRRPFF